MWIEPENLSQELVAKPERLHALVYFGVEGIEGTKIIVTGCSDLFKSTPEKPAITAR